MLPFAAPCPPLFVLAFAATPLVLFPPSSLRCLLFRCPPSPTAGKYEQIFFVRVLVCYPRRVCRFAFLVSFGGGGVCGSCLVRVCLRRVRGLFVPFALAVPCFSFVLAVNINHTNSMMPVVRSLCFSFVGGFVSFCLFGFAVFAPLLLRRGQVLTKGTRRFH